MTNRFLFPVAGMFLAATTALAQISPMGSAFQQPGWIAAPGANPMGSHSVATVAQSGPVVGRPISGTESRRTVQMLADGTRVEDASTSRFYRDSMGRMRSESPTQVLIYDPVAGFIYHLDPRNKRFQKDPIRDPETTVSIAVIGNRTSVSTSSTSTTTSRGSSGGYTTQHADVSPQRAERKVQVNRPQPNTEELAAQAVNGIYCRGSRVTETIPAGTFGNDRDVKVVSERWYSDDLQLLVKTSNSDPRFGVTTYELTNSLQAPPDPTLFQVPGDYTLKQDSVNMVIHH